MNRGKGALFSLTVLYAFCCIFCVGCAGRREAGEQAGEGALTSVPDDAGESVPAYSAQDDRLAADYLREQYGILPEGNVPKVILDCDMTYLGDDAMCLCILAQADTLGLIDLLGVTITGGNGYVAVGANAALNTLEAIGREDIPVYMGTDVPLGGFRDPEEQEKIVGSMDHWGAMWHQDQYIGPEGYHDLGPFYEREWGYSRTEPRPESSVDFMIGQTKAYPGEVTLLSAGAATNIAQACQSDAAFASRTAGIIYTGTIVEGPGTYTPHADFNVFYDAEAFWVCLNSAFPMQTIVPHDAAESAMLCKPVFDLMNEKERTLISVMWLDGQYSLYRRTPSRRAGCTDAMAAVALLAPEDILEKKKLYVTVNTDVSDAEYGHTTVWEDEAAEEEAASAAFVLRVDTERYWDFVTDLICHTKTGAEHSYSYYAEQNE